MGMDVSQLERSQHGAKRTSSLASPPAVTILAVKTIVDMVTKLHRLVKSSYNPGSAFVALQGITYL